MFGLSDGRCALARGVGIGFLALVALICGSNTPAWGVRLKEISAIQGVRDNPLVGYGLVVGLMGTGDQNNIKFTATSIANLLQRMGIRINPELVKVKNVAAVMVTTHMAPFVRPGQTLDVQVASMGDAKSLQGGTLILTPLRAADGEVYALAQGPVSVGGFTFGGNSGSKVQQNHPTVGVIPNGGTVEREVQVSLQGKGSFRLVLHRDDFITAQRASAALNDRLGNGVARCLDSRTLELLVPPGYSERVAEFLAAAEAVELQPDASGKVILDERTGTVIMGERVRIDPVAIAQGGLTVVIRETPEVVPAAPFAPKPPKGSLPSTNPSTGVDLAPGGQTAVVPRTEVQVDDRNTGVVLLQSGVTIGELVRALNAIGVTPRQLITILQAIHRAGALHANLEVM
jgi:flagellar P-ring protein FlgI